jgi:nucleotide-binding universal stress UspA family protein
MSETILVPLDGSSAAQITLPYAVEIAAKLGSDITLLRVSEPHADLDIYHFYLEHITEQVHNQLDAYGAKDARVFSAVIQGRPADEILRHADESNASLIVMASRGSSGQGPWLLGNIAAKVLRATKRPVLLIRAPASETAMEQKGLVKRILIPLDGSKIGEVAIPFTETLAQALGSEIVLFHVIEPAVTTFAIPEDGVPGTMPLKELREYPDLINIVASEPGVTGTVPVAEESRKASAIAYLDDVARPLKERGLNISREISTGSTAELIVDYAAENAIDLIAMSTHGRSGTGRWVFGSVTDKVLHAGDTPVLVIQAIRS